MSNSIKDYRFLTTRTIKHNSLLYGKDQKPLSDMALNSLGNNSIPSLRLISYVRVSHYKLLSIIPRFRYLPSLNDTSISHVANHNRAMANWCSVKHFKRKINPISSYRHESMITNIYDD